MKVAVVRTAANVDGTVFCMYTFAGFGMLITLTSRVLVNSIFRNECILRMELEGMLSNVAN